MNPGSELPLRDIHLPDPVSWWPPAPGWWMLLTLLVAIALLSGLLHYRHRRNALQRAAQQALHKIGEDYRQSGDARLLAQQLSILLRRVSLSCYPRQQVAGLTGCDWLGLLDRTLPGDDFQHGAGRVLIDAPYALDSRVDGPALLQLCERWLRQLCKAKGVRA
ncbi:MAG: DUF4381 domain-containing protein [Pseudomonadota bacterium]|nr:DUF4381 domain-containing protein [Pseudomonadota bacterium]